MKKEYYLGLDIGSESVGWAVTDTDYKIPKFNGNAMWGIRLFNESESAEQRRGFRSARRRYNRAKERITALEMLFDEEYPSLMLLSFKNSRKAIFIQRIKQTAYRFAYLTTKAIQTVIFTGIIRPFII